jgi:hypothetical protein
MFVDRRLGPRASPILACMGREALACVGSGFCGTGTPACDRFLACMGKEALAAALVFDFGLAKYQVPNTKNQALLAASSQ